MKMATQDEENERLKERDLVISQTHRILPTADWGEERRFKRELESRTLSAVAVEIETVGSGSGGVDSSNA